MLRRYDELAELRAVTLVSSGETRPAREAETLSNAPEILAVAVEEKDPSKVPVKDPVSETDVADIVLVPPIKDREPEIEGLSILIILWFCLYV